MELKTYMIDKVLNEFLAEFGCVTEMGEDFAYYYEDDVITYTLAVPENGVDYFMENWHNLAPEMTIDPFLASIMHEVAHTQTLHLLTKEESDYCEKAKKELGLALELRATLQQENKDCYFKYFALPDEKIATDWAIEYIRNHTQKISDFWQKLQAAIMEFYIVNNVEV